MTPARRPFELTGGPRAERQLWLEVDEGDDELAPTRGCLWAVGPALVLWALGLALLAVLVCCSR